LGWKLGSNVRIDYRWAAVDDKRIRQYAVDLVATAPDVILAAGSTIVRALQRATTTLPIVFANVGDPVIAARAQQPAPERHSTFQPAQLP
jgi:putative ABC transport system substrate-binding protein